MGVDNPLADWVSESVWGSVQALKELDDYANLPDDLIGSSKRCARVGERGGGGTRACCNARCDARVHLGCCDPLGRPQHGPATHTRALAWHGIWHRMLKASQLTHTHTLWPASSPACAAPSAGHTHTHTWRKANQLTRLAKGLQHTHTHTRRWREWMEHERPEDEALPGDWKRMPEFDRLLLFR
jgi:hypothetical protein